MPLGKSTTPLVLSNVKSSVAVKLIPDVADIVIVVAFGTLSTPFGCSCIPAVASISIKPVFTISLLIELKTAVSALMVLLVPSTNNVESSPNKLPLRLPLNVDKSSPVTVARPKSTVP